MNQNNALLKGIENLATLVSTMVATSRTGIEVVAERPAVEREGMKSINYKLAAGLVAISCGGTNIHNYYGPNGEIISSGEGNCDGFKGKYLAIAWECSMGTMEPIGDDCRLVLETRDPNIVLPGFIDGRTLYLQVGPKGKPVAWEMYRAGEFSIDDLAPIYSPEYQQRMAERFMCYFRVDPTLVAIKNAGAPKLIPAVDYIYRLSDIRYFRGACTPGTIEENSPWNQACTRR